MVDHRRVRGAVGLNGYVDVCSRDGRCRDAIARGEDEHEMEHARSPVLPDHLSPLPCALGRRRQLLVPAVACIMPLLSRSRRGQESRADKKVGMLLHDWNLDRKMQLVRAARAAIRDGGAFIAVEMIIDDARRETSRES
jgi:hypothetical protein